MSILNKFGKKDDLDLDSELPPLDSGLGNSPPDSTGLGLGQLSGPPDKPSFDMDKEIEPIGGSPAPHTGGGDSIKQDLELINSKLDTIKAELNGMSQRLQKLEKIAEGEKNPQGKFISKDPWANY